jgi:DNA modification methylase
MTAALIRGDALRLPLADESVDLVVTSPPYFALRSYQDGGEHYAGQIGSEATPQAFIAALVAVTRELVRVLKPSGSIFVNLGDKYSGGSTGSDNGALTTSGLVGTPSQRIKVRRTKAPDGGIPAKSLMLLPERYRVAAVDQLGLIARAVIVWDKPNGLPESVTDRVRRSHEDWVHLTKAPRYYSAVDEIREAYLAPEARRTMGNVDPSRGDHGKPTARLDACDTMNPLGKLPGSVWRIASEPLQVPDWLGVDHYAAYPQEWPRRLILGWSPPGGVILDPFVGTGTTVMVARALGRYGIGVDLSADYLRLARWRIWQSGHSAKTMNRTWTERQETLL